jgi:cyanophycin synthetase
MPDINLSEIAGDLRVRGVRALRGPNLWHRAPVVVAEIELGRLASVPPVEADGFLERLLDALPTLGERDDMAGATTWAEVMEHVAVELHELVGAPVAFSCVAVAAGEDGEDVVAIEYAEEALGIESVYEAQSLVRRVLRGEDADSRGVIDRLRVVYLEAHPPPTLMVMLEAARKRGIPIRRTPEDFVVQLGLGCNLRRLDSTMTDRTSVIATDITSDKDRTKRILDRVGLPVPRGGVAESVDDALRIAEDLGFPVLLKPLDANDGRGISGRIDSIDGVRAAYEIAVAEHPKVVVERYAEGRDHRVTVVDGRVVAVAERVPAHVVGDGKRTVRELAEAENRDPKRDPLSPRATLRPLPIDERTQQFIARSGMTLDSVPAAGETVWLRATANISTGGTAIDRTDEIHPRNAAMCELAAAATGLDVAGMDVLTSDISLPFDENGAVIVEVNASPGIRMHTDPDVGAPRDVPGAILDMLYPPGSECTIPILAVTGTNGKTTTTRLIAHLFRRAGKRVGYTTTDGVYLGDLLLMEGDLTGPFAANVILSHPRVELAVLETARGGILRSGLGFEGCDVGVVLNVASDHLGMRGIHTVEQLAEVKAVIASAVKPGGTCVLNADQPLVFAMRERTAGEVVLFSMQGMRGNPLVAQHLAAGRSAVVLEEEDGREWLVLRRGAERAAVAAVDEVPLTLGGAARFQVANLLAGIAAAHGCGMEIDRIRDGILSFLPSASTTPGRMNVLRTARGRVIVDYAHNPAAVAALVEMARRLDAGRRIGVLTMPGDRRDDDLRELGRAAATLDFVIAKEHPAYARGRAPGEVARLIREGLEAGGLPADRHESVLDETEAVARALDMMEDGDVVVIVADDTDAVLAQIQPLVVEE